MSSPGSPPTQRTLPNCHPYACAIQTCLGRSSADAARCQTEIGRLYACCRTLYRALQDEGETDVDQRRATVKGAEACPMLSVLKRNLRSHDMSYDDDDKGPAASVAGPNAKA